MLTDSLSTGSIKGLGLGLGPGPDTTAQADPIRLGGAIKIPANLAGSSRRIPESVIVSCHRDCQILIAAAFKFPTKLTTTTDLWTKSVEWLSLRNFV